MISLGSQVVVYGWWCGGVEEGSRWIRHANLSLVAHQLQVFNQKMPIQREDNQFFHIADSGKGEGRKAGCCLLVE